MKKVNDLANSLRVSMLRDEKEMDAQEISRLRAENRKLKGLIVELEKTIQNLNNVFANRDMSTVTEKE